MANLAQQKSFSIGGRSFTEAEVARFESGTLTAGGGVILRAHVLTAARFSPLLNGVSTAFQVGAAVSLNCVAMKVSVYGTSSSGAQLMYSDDATTVDDTAATNIVYQMGTANYPAISLSPSGPGTAEIYFGTKGFIVPSNKYISAQTNGGSVSVYVYCFID